MEGNSAGKENRSEMIEKVIRTHADMIYRIAYQNTGNYDDAEDILQEVSIALITKNAPLHDEEYLKRWLIRVTVNKCRDMHRHKKRIKTEPLEEHTDKAAETKSEIWEELFSLHEKYRIVLYLYYYENFTIKDIALTLKKSVNTVSSDLQRARKKLKIIITEEEDRDENKQTNRSDGSCKGTA